MKQKYPNFIKEIRGEGCLQGIIFNSGPKVLNNLISYIPIELTKDDRFLSKLVTSSIISNLYSEFDILTSLGQNREICLWISPSIIINLQRNRFLNSLDKTLSHGYLKLLKFYYKEFKYAF